MSWKFVRPGYNPDDWFLTDLTLCHNGPYANAEELLADYYAKGSTFEKCFVPYFSEEYDPLWATMRVRDGEPLRPRRTRIPLCAPLCTAVLVGAPDLGVPLCPDALSTPPCRACKATPDPSSPTYPSINTLTLATTITRP